MPIHINCRTDSTHREPYMLRLALVNNMPEAAFAATEKQFLSLLEKGSSGVSICVSLFSLPGMLPAGQQGRYQSLDALVESELDGLIVTGREPSTPDLRAEPYWDSFGVLLEWAQKRTLSTVWSCLAAHAAVLKLDGVARKRRREKYFGVFSCKQTAAHALTVKMPSHLRCPHSRWNGLHGEELRSNGYKLLTCTTEGEVDLFIKEGESLFIFAQGHPEYDTDTLLREYRRDLGRYTRSELEVFPELPASYFSIETQYALDVIRERGGEGRTEAVLAESLSVLAQAVLENSWATSAECLYQSWIALLAEKKRLHKRPVFITSAADPRPSISL